MKCMKHHDKLQNAGILGTGQPFTEEEKEVIESLTTEEVDAWVRIKEKLDKGGIVQPECKFFI